jgi:hypothetical protein
MGQRGKQRLIEAFVTQAPVDPKGRRSPPLDEAVLNRLAGRDVMSLDPPLL